MVNSSNSSTSTPRFSATDRLFFGGLASGLDTSSIIDALTAVASRPITLAQQRIATLENRKKALGTINSSLLNLLSSLDALRKPETGRARTASLLDTAQSAYLGVSASSAAAIGTFGVEILGLATATKLGSAQAIGQPVSCAIGAASTARR